MEDWHDMLPTKNGKATHQIQWSPSGHGQVRAKLSSEILWRTAPCMKAENAISIGDQLIAQGTKGENRSLQKV